MKRNGMMKLAIFLLIVVALSFSTISGTFAKYASSYTKSDSARVAKWDIKLNGEAWSDSVAFNLFTYTDTNVDVDGDGTEKVIAPGTTGSFNFSVENDSEVTAEYSIKLAVENPGNIPLEYKVGDSEWTLPNDEGEIEVAGDTLDIGSDAQEVTVQWRWAFEGTDSVNFKQTQTDITDTALGEADTLAEVTVTATINATQVN